MQIQRHSKQQFQNKIGVIEMAEIYTCKMTKTMIFDIKANSMEEAQDWCATHDFEDVQKASTYWAVDYSESVSELEDDRYVAVDISEQNGKDD